MPPLALLSSLTWVFLAVQEYRRPLFGRLARSAQDAGWPLALYSMAAALIPCIVPFTLTAMMDVNSRLNAKVNNGTAEGKWNDGEVDKLLKKWVMLNWTRAVIAAMGTACGAIAVAGRFGAIEVVV